MSESEDLQRLRAWLEEGHSAKRLPPDEQASKDYPLEGRRTLDDLTRALLPPTRRATRADITEAERASVGWRSIGFEAEDVRPWLAAGVSIHGSALVADLVEEGITPQRAAVQFQHPRTGEMTTILQVALAVSAMFRTHSYRSLTEALDDAEIERVRGLRPSAIFRRRRDSA